jgi:DNA-binding beta-propeller fold protein YncE
MKKKSLFVIILLFLVPACATHKQLELPKVFYPAPPALARVQFLTSLTGEKDYTQKKSAFETFVTGVGESQRRIDKPYGVAIWNGRIYVCDVNQGLIVLDLEKKTFGGIPGDQGMGKLIGPLNIRIGTDGSKYVSDPVRGQVVVFDKNDNYISTFGSNDTWKPVDAVPYEDQLFVADIKNSRIVVLDRKSGDTVRILGQGGDPKERLHRPSNLAFDTEGHLYVSDTGRFQIIKLDRDGHHLGKIGEMGQEAGTFSRPKGIALDREGRLFVVDAAFGNIQMFSKDGNNLFFFSKFGDGPGDMNLPAQVVVDYDNIRYFSQYADPHFTIEGIVIVTNQVGDKSLNIYAFGKEKGKKYPTDAELLEQMKVKLLKKAKDSKSEAPKENP